MTTTELIEFLATKTFTTDQAYNLIVSDLYEAVPEEMVVSEAGQKIIGYFLYKIQNVCLPAIEQAKSDVVRRTYVRT